MDARPHSHHLGTHGSLRLLVAAALVLILALTLEASPAAGASRTACRVRNADTGRAYTRLQQAVDAAKSGQALVVKGICHGATVINKNLLIEGERTRKTGKPTLDGDGRSRPLTIKRSRPNKIPRVEIRGLTVQHGRASPPQFVSGYGGEVGGGIWANGTLKLRDVIVRNSRAAVSGGGIYAAWADIRLIGATRIMRNKAPSGGGIDCWNCGVTLSDASSIQGNTASDRGGGLWGFGFALTLNDASNIRGNTAGSDGGGVWGVEEGITLNDASSIRDNTAGRSGGGVFDDTENDEESWYGSSITLDGTSSITGNRAAAADSCCEKGCGGPRSRAGGV